MRTTMKAIVYTKYGAPDVLQYEDVDKPTPNDDEILIKVYAASVNAADWHYLRGAPYIFRLASGPWKPKNIYLGADVAGRVEAVGQNVTQFKPGDEVFGDLSKSGRGSFAEYVCARADAVVLKPENVSFEDAAAVPLAAVTALRGLHGKGRIQSGQRVLINGASGGVGTFAVQIAKSFGAEVTGVCSTRNIENVRSIGADHVIDYTAENFTKSGKQYDLILGANGYQPIMAYRRALAPGGTYVMSGGANAQMMEALLFGPLISMTGSKKLGNFLSSPDNADLTMMRDLLGSGKVVSVIDKTYPLSKTADAIRYLESGHAQGKVVISVGQTN